MESNKLLEKINDTIEEIIKPILKKGESMTPVDLEVLNKGVCIIEKIKRIGEGNCFDDDGYSYRRERSSYTGRFVSRDSMPSYDGASNVYHAGATSRRYYDGGSMYNGYSGHSRHDMTIYHIENLIDAAQSEQERQFLSEWLRRVKNN